jgi:CheY-like chemotaxis protein
MHGGTVSAESPGAGRGAIFSVRLPQLGSEVGRSTEGPAPLAAPIANGVGTADLRGITVLLVDDESDAREAVAMLLAQCGARVTQAPSADDAWTALQLELPDVVVSDLAMPNEDGFSLLRRLRGADSEPLRRLPVIALTAYNAEADRRRVIAAGFDLHLAKPTDGGALARGVAQLARQR